MSVLLLYLGVLTGAACVVVYCANGAPLPGTIEEEANSNSNSISVPFEYFESPSEIIAPSFTAAVVREPCFGESELEEEEYDYYNNDIVDNDDGHANVQLFQTDVEDDPFINTIGGNVGEGNHPDFHEHTNGVSDEADMQTDIDKSRVEDWGGEEKEEEEGDDNEVDKRMAKVYEMFPGSFHNVYMDKIFRNRVVGGSTHHEVSFPTKAASSSMHFASLDDFETQSKLGIKPMVFQFVESDVRDILGPYFDLARAVVRDPENQQSADAFSSILAKSPMTRLIVDDCMNRSPNPDAYEAQMSSFLKSYREARRRGVGDDDEIVKTLEFVPDGEGLSNHRSGALVDKTSMKELDGVTNAFSSAQDAFRAQVTGLRKEWSSLWDEIDDFELLGDFKKMDELTEKVHDIERNISRLSPGGVMWNPPSDIENMFHSSWSMDDFHRYTNHTPNISSILSWMLDEYDAPFQNSGAFYYPPMSSRMWHTNIYSGGKGWRAYIVRKWPPDGNSGVNVLHPNTGKILHMPDLNEMHINIFKVTDARAPLWHCVYSENAHRFSLGYKMHSSDVYKILVKTSMADSDNEALSTIKEKWAKLYESEMQNLAKEEQERIDEMRRNVSATGGGPPEEQ